MQLQVGYVTISLRQVIAKGLSAMEFKTCNKCGNSLPANRKYFYKRNSGLRGECKSCKKKSSNTYTTKNKHAIKLRHLLVCKQCFGNFHSSDKNQKLCSKKCQNEWQKGDEFKGIVQLFVSDSLSDREKEFACKMEESVAGFIYVRGYTNTSSPMFIKCKKCKSETVRSAIAIRKAIREGREIRCSTCVESNKIIDAKREQKSKELYKRIVNSVVKHKTSLKQVHINECKECGILHGSNRKNALYCSDVCRNRNANKRKEIKSRLRMSRAKDNGSFDSSISLVKLYEKHKGVCYICETICSWDDHIITNEGHFIVSGKYPSVEHIQPLSKGGTHSWDNVELACMKCNTEKSNKLFSEDSKQISFNM